MSSGDPLVGHVLDGRYEILRKLARGGMATV
jgi:serine/threonine-protein kinase